MAFLLTNFDPKPMRIKGESRFTALAVSNLTGPLEKGAYRGLGSGAVIEVLSAGGFALPTDEAQAAFAISQPVPISFKRQDESAQPIMVDEVFVREGSSELYRKTQLTCRALNEALAGFWLPVKFNGGASGSGWVRLSSNYIEGLVPEGCDLNVMDFSPIHQKQCG